MCNKASLLSSRLIQPKSCLPLSHALMRIGGAFFYKIDLVREQAKPRQESLPTHDLVFKDGFAKYHHPLFSFSSAHLVEQHILSVRKVLWDLPWCGL